MDVSPLALILVKNGSRGDRLLFKYPYESNTTDGNIAKNVKRTPYSSVNKENLNTKPSLPSVGKLTGFSDKILSNLFAVGKRLCEKKFELKISDVRFVGHPINLEGNKKSSSESSHLEESHSSITMFHFIFALKATISYDIVNCYHDLSRRLGIALSYEEQRCQFLSNEAKMMMSIQEEVSQLPEASQYLESFEQILAKSQIAKDMKKIHVDLCNSSEVHLMMNNWIDISFCIPQNIPNDLGGTKRLTHDALMQGLKNVKSYHTLLLLVDQTLLLDSLAPDVSPALRRLLHVESPINPFYTLAADADLTLHQVILLAGHLVYWGKATIIYPVCNTNIYTLSPHVSTQRNSKLCEKFQEEFPGCSYHETLSEFSLPISLRDKCSPMSHFVEQQNEKQKLLWLLRHGLLQQLHTYVYINLPSSSPSRSQAVRIHLPTVTESESERYAGGSDGSLQYSDQDETETSFHDEPSKLSDDENCKNLTENFIGKPSPVQMNLSPFQNFVNTLDTFFSQSEKESFMKLERTHSIEDIKEFSKLLPYLRGEHHLEEMMSHLNISRSSLLEILDKFRSVLITTQRPDRNITF